MIVVIERKAAQILGYRIEPFRRWCARFKIEGIAGLEDSVRANNLITNPLIIVNT